MLVTGSGINDRIKRKVEKLQDNMSQHKAATTTLRKIPGLWFCLK
jgi:hypothetical protein